MNEKLHTGEAIDSGITHELETMPEAAPVRSLGGKVAERGASLVEYALLLALIAVVCIAAVGALGGATAEPYTDLTETGLS